MAKKLTKKQPTETANINMAPVDIIAFVNQLGIKLELTGQRFAKLSVIEKTGDDWLCRCDCGKEITLAAIQLTSGANRSCGCRP